MQLYAIARGLTFEAHIQILAIEAPADREVLVLAEPFAELGTGVSIAIPRRARDRDRDRRAEQRARREATQGWQREDPGRTAIHRDTPKFVSPVP